MSIQLQKEEIKTNEVIGQKTSQTMVECDVIVPDVKPDIKKVLEVSGYVCITQRAIQQDKVFLQGIVRMTALYLPENDGVGKLKSLTANQEFTHIIDCRGASPQMQLFAEANVEHFDFTLINSRKVNLRCRLLFGIKVTKPVVLSLATQVENPADIALKKERLRLMESTGNCECQIILREQLEFPSGKPTIGEILRITANPSSTEFQVFDQKAVAKGEVRICTLYTGEEDGSIQFMEHLIPFSEILDMEEARESMTGEIDYGIHDIFYEARDDADGEARNLGIELVLTANARGTETAEIEGITDAYALKGDLELTTRAYAMEQLIDTVTAEIVHKEQAELPPMLPKLKQVCDVHANAKIDRITIEDNQINVFGNIHTNILYLTEDDAVPVSGFQHIAEFSHTFPITGDGTGMICDAQVFLNHTGYTLSGNETLELRFVLGVCAKIFQAENILFIEEMQPVIPEHSKPCPNMILYFVRSGDSLWKIAKKYHTTVDAIKKLNELEGDTIYPGQRLKIVSACA